MMLLAACSGSTDYFESKDIDHVFWSPADSVFFPVCVAENPDLLEPVKWNVNYDLTLTGRYSFDYPYQTLPVWVCFQQMDSLGWHDFARPFRVTIPTVDEEGFLDGGNWGSLFKKELLITGRKVCFPSPGDYRIIILPDTILHGVVSMTVELESR